MRLKLGYAMTESTPKAKVAIRDRTVFWIGVSRVWWKERTGEGAKYTKTRLPVSLAYVEEFERIDEAFQREKQIQGWNRKKTQALIAGDFDKLSHLPLEIELRQKQYEYYRDLLLDFFKPEEGAT